MQDEAIHELLDGVLSRLEEAADPERAREAKRFFPGEARVLGTPSGWSNELGRDLSNALRTQGGDASDALWLAEKLYCQQTMEAGAVANEMLGRWWRQMGEDDWERFDRWLDWFDNWGTTDSFCLKVSGQLAVRDGAPSDMLRSWAESDSVWRKRAALVTLIPAARKGGERDLLLELCADLLDDDEPYVQKAIGWSLKELCKGDLEAVIEFVQDHGDAMPASTVRYACERMTDTERALARSGV